ncbi:MAG: hypothetical protein Kow0029_28200 [Candidatus Rifleibacteriota bacterium]
MKNQCWLYTLLVLALVICFSNQGFAQNNPFDEENTVSDPQTSDSPFAITDSTAAADETMEIDGSWVNVRSGPGIGNAVIKTLPRGSRGRKLQERNGWSKIDFGNGLIGWVYNKLLAKVDSDPQNTNDDSADSSTSVWVNKQFERWDRHLGGSLLDYTRFPWYWRLKRAYNAFNKGDYQSALSLAQAASGNQLEAAYMQAKCYAKLGNTDKAERLLKILEKHFEDIVMRQKLDEIAKPYIDEPIVFKFGGFDDIETYKKKKAQGNRLGLNSGEYYEKFVDIKTWKWRSKSAYEEFKKIGGIDCSGFVQKIQKEAFDKAGVKYPITQGRTSTSGLWSKKYTDEINPGVKPPPPPDIRPGDMILLDYGHNRYGHSMIYKGTDSKGNIIVLQMGDTAQEAILPAHKYQYYKGTFRMKGMDKAREMLTA